MSNHIAVSGTGIATATAGSSRWVTAGDRRAGANGARFAGASAGGGGCCPPIARGESAVAVTVSVEFEMT